MKFLRMAGTWIPLFLAVVFLVTLIDANHGNLTWERPITYLIGCFSLVFGLWALIDIARLPRGDFPTLFMLSLIYQKVFLCLIYASLVGFTGHEVIPWLPVISEAILFALFVSSTLATSMVNWLLWFARKHPWLELEVDPVPFRPIWQRWRSRK